MTRAEPNVTLDALISHRVNIGQGMEASVYPGLTQITREGWGGCGWRLAARKKSGVERAAWGKWKRQR